MESEQWIKKKKIKENDRILWLNENKNTIYQNLWYAVKAVFTQKFIPVNTYIKKKKKIAV